MVPPAGGGPTGRWPRISPLGLARPGPAKSNLATRRSPTGPDPRPGSRVGPQLHRTGRRHVPRLCGPHEGVLNCSLSDPSSRAMFAMGRGRVSHIHIHQTFHILLHYNNTLHCNLLD
ncbi:hypothetical protein GOODEAATRI_011186 [Goodea atripinnis]|uniref:Uncharacterized protein n=1 Tax=Goodea atripinnis TaxID=208336 RepID=A0ABV0N0G2_9TELE